MKIFKRCDCPEPDKCPHTFHYVFGFRSVMYRGSTREKAKTKAERKASRIQSEVERGERISGKVPKLADYAVTFLQWVDGHQTLKPESKRYYHRGVKLLSGPLGSTALDKITPASLETIKFNGGPATANCRLRTLRRMLNRAHEDGLLGKVPRVRCRAEEPRTMVLDSAAEERLAPYLPQTAREVVSLMRDTGGRNGEVLSMRWEFVDWVKGQYRVPSGKTKSAKRLFPPLSSRVCSTSFTADIWPKGCLTRDGYSPARGAQAICSQSMRCSLAPGRRRDYLRILCHTVLGMTRGRS
jgi:hypothetical protein